MTTSDASTVQPNALNTLLVIGAGEGRDIPPDWQEHFQRLVLVEPLPELARSLRLAFGEDPNVKVLETAIIPGVNAGDTVTLYEFNWAQASSRHQPADLLQLFPGLKTERMRRVSALSPQQLIRELDLSADGEHALVLEAPADEGPIISALIESDAHKAFSRIQLRYPAPGLYDNPTDPEAMLQALKASGFEIETQDQTDPDWPSVSFTRNRWKLALKAAKETIKTLKAELAEQNEARESEVSAREQLEQQLNDTKAALSKHIAEGDEQTKRADEQAATAKQEAQARAKAEQLAEERGSQIATLETRLKEHQQTLEKRTAERDAQAKRTDDQAATAKQEAQARAKAEQLAEERSRQLTERQQQLQRVQQELAELQTRQALLQEELVRAEAQIDLIKDLLLSEQNL